MFDTILIAILIVLVVGAITLLILLLRRQNRVPNADSLGLLAQQIGQATQQQTQALNHLTGQLSQRLDATAALAQQSQQLITQRLTTADQAIGDLKGQLGQLTEATRNILQVGGDVRKLQDILQAPKLRGSLGEWSLEGLLAQVLPASAFTIQHRFQNGTIADALIRLADNRCVAIDAKFPLSNFQRALEATEDGERARSRKAFFRDVKGHVDAIASKYILPEEGTLDFALMYVPAENVYYEILQPCDGVDFGDYAREKRIIPVSPNTLYAYLMVVSLGLRGLQIEQNARRIYGRLNGLANELGQFVDIFSIVGKHISNAHAKHDEASRRLEMFTTRLRDLHAEVDE